MEPPGAAWKDRTEPSAIVWLQLRDGRNVLSCKLSTGFTVSGLRVLDLGFRVRGLGLKGLGFRVWGLRFGVALGFEDLEGSLKASFVCLSACCVCCCGFAF